MPNNLNYDVWLIGPGGMGIEYANVLSSLGKSFLTIGRGENSASFFTASTNQNVLNLA